MLNKRLFIAVAAFLLPCFLLYAGTGRPGDGFLSFIIILGFLCALLGIVHLVEIIKNRIRKFLDNIGLEEMF